ncbi:hypothetical protein Tco_1231342, partial [Tanacetum coccineum]
NTQTFIPLRPNLGVLQPSPKMAPSTDKKKVLTIVDSGGNTFMSGVQEEGKSSTPLVEKINMFEQQKIDSEDEVEYVDNEMASFLASKPSAVGYGTNNLLEPWRETYGNADYDYDPYDDDMYEGQEIPDNIQFICDNLDIKVRGRKKK